MMARHPQPRTRRLLHSGIRVSADLEQAAWERRLDESERRSRARLAAAEAGAAEVKAKIAEYHRRWPEAP